MIGCALVELLARRTNSFYRLKRADACKRILNASIVIAGRIRIWQTEKTAPQTFTIESTDIWLSDESVM